MKHITVFQGADYQLVEQQIDSVVKKHLPQASSETALTRYYASALPAENFWSKLTVAISMPVFGASHQVAVVYDFDLLKPLEKLKQAINSCTPSCFLFLLTRDLKCLSPGLKKFLQTHPQVDYRLEKFVKRERMQERLQTFSRQHGLQFSKEALQFLVHSFAKHPHYLEQELEKIALFFTPPPTAQPPLKSSGKIEIAALTAVLQPLQEASVFKVQDALFYKQKKETFLQLSLFFQQVESAAGSELTGLLFALLRQAELLLAYRSLSARYPLPRLFQKLQLNYEFQQKALQRQAKQTSNKALRSLLHGLLLVEKILKSNYNVSMKVGAGKVNWVAKTTLEKHLFLYLET